MRPTKEQVMAFLKPSPVTKEELAGLEKLAPGDYEIYSERINMILAECKDVFSKVGNSNWVLSGDLIVGLHNKQGDLISSCIGTFIHSVTAQNPIKWIMHNFWDNPRVGVHEGDIFYCNEATYGGIHNCDQLALMPIFNQGELIAWASSGTHMDETGGIAPGGMIAYAKSRYDEGMNLTPIKIAENYQLSDDLIEMLVNRISRAPRQQVLDLRARCTAVDRLRMRIQQLAEQKGNDFVRGLLRKTMVAAEEGARNRIRRWNDGVYRNLCFQSGIGSKPGVWRIFCTAHKQGDHILFDYTGTSPENDSSYNCFPWVMVCYAALHLYSHGFWDLPVCTGTMAPIDFRIPDGTVISPHWDAAISMAPPVGELNTQLLPKLLACMMFSTEDRLQIAAPQNQILGTGGMIGGAGSVGGFGFGSGLNQHGVPSISQGGGGWTRNTGGQGARVDSDGMDSAIFRSAVHATGSDGEEAEADQPVLHLWQKHRKDSPGNGKYRGGASGYVATIFYGVSSAKRAGTIGGVAIPRMLVGQGLFGGYPSNAAPGVGVENSNILELMARGEKNIPTSPEEIIRGRVITGDYFLPSSATARPPRVAYEGSLSAGGGAPGGKGYGDVLEREPQAVVDDVRNEIVSEWTASNVYHVAYDVETWTADAEKTQDLRKLEREKRLRLGKRYDEFETEWLKKKPPEGQMAYYGSWPDARMVNPIIRI
jgi:N-methylhydantoinase B/oxoprolinase/acetone carboxylase alpha subunit